MTAGLVKTQGTELFVADTIRHSTPTRVKFACPTGITGLGGPRDQVESTCLDTVGDKEFEAGLGNPGPVNVPFNYIPTDEGHQFLFDWKQDGRNMNWLIGLSDGDDVPTVTGDAFNTPADRSGFKFSGYVSDVNIDIATNELVRGTMIIQRSGNVTPFAKSA